MTALASLHALRAVILALLVVTQTPTQTVYAPHAARHPNGAQGYATEVAEHLHAAAKLHDVDVALLAALAYYESAFDRRARSRVGALGMLQLMPQFRWGRAWRADCRILPSECDALNVAYGAAALRDGIQVCGSHVRAVGRYRTGRCVAGPRARATVVLAQQVRFRLKHPSTRRLVVRRLR